MSISHPRSLIVLLVLALVGLTLLPGNTPLAQGQAPEALAVSRQVTPPTATLGKDEFTVSLQLTGNNAVCERKVVQKSSDIILVIDHSGSMGESAGDGTSATKMSRTKDAAKTFLSKINLGRDHVGLVEFQSAASVAHPLSSDLQSLTDAINQFDANGGTAMDQGIVMAQRELKTARARPEANQIIVLLTDGKQSGAAPLAAAKKARDDGVRLITIGLGADADQSLLRDMASQPSDSYYAPSAGDLDRIYATIAETVLQANAASDVVVEHTFDATTMEVVPGSVSPSGTVNGDRITWKLKDVLNQSIVLSYRLRPRAPGTYSVDRGDLIRYTRCGDTPQELRLPPEMSVAVQAPPTATPVPTSTPFPTLRPIAPVVIPQTAGAAAAANSRLGPFCDMPWWGWLLALLLLLFFAWWVWNVWKEWQKGARERSMCRWIPWLLAPLGLLFLSQLVPLLTSNMCATESVYFWRIEPGQNNGSIYVTDQGGAKPASEFKAFSSERTCVGCHTVSSSSHRIAAFTVAGVGPLIVYNLDGTRIEVPRIDGSYAAWSPDGSKLAVATSDQDIVILDIGTKAVTKLAGASDPTVAEAMPAWSPDGQYIAFVRGKTAGSSLNFEGPTDIYVVPATGGAAIPLPGASGDGFNYYPSYSPNGRWLAFTRHTTGRTTYAAPEAEIFVVPAVGGDRIRLRANDDAAGQTLKNVSNSWPTWSRTGDMLAFNSKRNDDRYDLFVTPIDPATGQSGAAMPLASASQPGVFEHLPFWGEPPQTDILAGVLGLWPWLIPVLLILLAWYLCRRLQRRYVPPPVVETTPVRMPPGPLPPINLDPLWQVSPTLVIGVGGTGRWVLTHLKKALKDGGRGVVPDNVKFVLLDTSVREEANVLRDNRGDIVGVEFAGVSLEPDEMLLMGPNLSKVIEVSNADADRALQGWFPYNDYRTLPLAERSLQSGTFSRRPMARAGLIEKLRQGTPSGDGAGGSLDPEVARDAARLWETLVGNSADLARRSPLVRIILVGSLTGGMSGVLSDLAYLARRAARGVVPTNGNVQLEGYFTTPGAFHEVVGDKLPILQLNTTASLREIGRFQMASGASFPITYARGSETSADGQTPLTGSINWQLFDDISLFGSRGDVTVAPGKSREPWATTFASMADVISFRMDSGVAAGARLDYRQNVRNQVAVKQQQTGQAIVGAAGSYVYRLPMMDIVDIVTARWARKLFDVFLGGSVTAATTSVAPAASGLPSTHTADDAARRFVTGAHEAGDPPEGMRAVGDLAMHAQPPPAEVRDLANGSGRPFAHYLDYALRLILNGTAASDANARQRGLRIDEGLAFAQAVQRLLQSAYAVAQDQQAKAAAEPAPAKTGFLQRLKRLLGGGEADATTWSEAAQQIQGWLQTVNRTIASLEGMRGLLVGIKDPQKRVHGLADELALRQTEVDRRRDQMDQVAVRQYLWSRPSTQEEMMASPQEQRDLATEWYAAVEGRLTRYLDRFYWMMAQDGAIRLGVVTFGKGSNVIALDSQDPKSVERVADELKRLAEYVVQEWMKEQGIDIDLADVLPTQLSTRENYPADKLVETIWPKAAPRLDPAANATGLDGEQIAAAGLSQDIQEDTDNESLTRLKGVFTTLGTPRSRVPAHLETVPTQVISTTDRMAMSLVREYTLMPLWDVPELRDALRIYTTQAGRQTQRFSEPAVRTPVFQAERNALAYEQRLEARDVVDEDYHVLHPLIVTALERNELAELYLLAFAAGWVQTRQDVAVIQIPGSIEKALPLPSQDAGSGGLDPRVAGLIRFAAGLPEDAALVTALRQAFDGANSRVTGAWNQFLDRYQPQAATTPVEPGEIRCVNGHPMEPGDKRCGECGALPAPRPPAPPAGPWRKPFADEPRVIQDLGAVAALVCYRRLTSEQDWERIVMTESRTLRRMA